MLLDKRIDALRVGYVCLGISGRGADANDGGIEGKGCVKGAKRKKRERKESKVKEKKATRRNDKWICSEKFDCVRSRHSAREGGGSSARWRWRVVCLAPGCTRQGLSYDKSDRLMHHVSRNPTCKLFWEEKIGSLPWVQ